MCTGFSLSVSPLGNAGSIERKKASRWTTATDNAIHARYGGHYLGMKMETERTEEWMIDEEIDALMLAQKPCRAVLPNRDEGYYHRAPDAA